MPVGIPFPEYYDFFMDWKTPLAIAGTYTLAVSLFNPKVGKVSRAVAKSSNAKIVIVGGGKDQMPLILGSDIATLPPGGGPSVDAAPATAGALPDWQQLPKLFPVPIAPTKPPITSGSALADRRMRGGNGAS